MRFKNISLIVWLISSCELQTFLIIKEDTKYSQTRRSYHTPQPSFGNFTHLWKLIQEKNFRKECCIMLLIGFLDWFIGSREFQTFSAKSVKIVKVFKYLAKS